MSGKKVKLTLDENEAVLISDLLTDLSALYSYTLKRSINTSMYAPGGFVPGVDQVKAEDDYIKSIKIISDKRDGIDAVNERLRFEMVNKKIKLKK